MITTLDTPATPADLLTMPDGDRYELIDGQLLESPVSFQSSLIAGQILRILGRYLDYHPNAGYVVPEGTTYQCFPNDRNRIRKPDVSFIRRERLSREQFESGHCRIAPDLAVEVISPNDLYVEVMRKLEDYFLAGVPLVWIVEPATKTITIHQDAWRSVTRLTESETLTAESLLPGFECSVKEVFPVFDFDDAAGGDHAHS